MSKQTTAGPPVEEMPSYWFCVMESAKERGDFEQAAQAKRELQRLGVRVIYEHPRPSKKGVSDVS